MRKGRFSKLCAAMTGLAVGKNCDAQQGCQWRCLRLLSYWIRFIEPIYSIVAGLGNSLQGRSTVSVQSERAW